MLKPNISIVTQKMDKDTEKVPSGVYLVGTKNLDKNDEMESLRSDWTGMTLFEYIECMKEWGDEYTKLAEQAKIGFEQTKDQIDTLRDQIDILMNKYSSVSSASLDEQISKLDEQISNLEEQRDELVQMEAAYRVTAQTAGFYGYLAIASLLLLAVLALIVFVKTLISIFVAYDAQKLPKAVVTNALFACSPLVFLHVALMTAQLMVFEPVNDGLLKNEMGSIFRIVLTEGINYGWIGFAMMIAVIVGYRMCDTCLKGKPKQNKRSNIQSK